MGIEGTIRTIESHRWFGHKFSCLHVDTSPESTRTIGRCTGTPLHLHVFYTRSKVRKIHPKYRMAFGIIDRNTIGSNIDTCTVRASYSNGSVTNTCTGITGADGTRCHAQQIGEVLPQVLLLKFLLADIGKSHRSSTCSTC